MNKKTLKSIGAVIAGFATVAILSVATDAVLEGMHILPPQTQPQAYDSWMLLLALAYRSVYAVVGGYVTAALAPSKPMKHVKILAILGTVGGILGVVAGWNLSEHWYPIALAVTAFPLVWFGGTLKKS
jgi:hypothetical protein